MELITEQKKVTMLFSSSRYIFELSELFEILLVEIVRELRLNLF